MFGCILTQAHNKRISGYKTITKEFRHFKTGQNFIKGVLVGKINFENEKHYHLQFADILEGENRYLNVYFKEKNYEYPYLFESDTKLKGKPAFAFVHKYFEHNPESVNYKFLSPSSNKIPPMNFFIEAMNIPQTEISFPLIVLNLGFSNIYTSSISKIIWQNDINEKISFERNFSLSDDNTIMPEIKYKKRSLFKLILWYLAYIIILPFDLITCPIQLILFRNMVK